MKAALKFIMTTVGLLLIGLFIVVALLLTRFEGLLRDGLTYEAGRILQSEVRLEVARFDWSERAFVFKGATIFNPEGFTDRDILRVESFSIKPDLMTLFSKTPTITYVRLRGPVIQLQFSTEKGTNLAVLTQHTQEWVDKQEAGHKTVWGRPIHLREIRVDALTGNVEKILPALPAVPLESTSFSITVAEGEKAMTGAGVLHEILAGIGEKLRSIESLDVDVKASLSPPQTLPETPESPV